MNEEKKINLAKIYWLGNNIQYCRLKARSVIYNNEKVNVKGEGSIINALEEINIALMEYNITPLVQKGIQKWINGLNDAYVLSRGQPPLLNLLNPNSIYLVSADAEALLRDIGHWREAILSSLENDFYKPCKIETALIDKSKLLSGLNSFLSEDILKHLSDNNKNDLNEAIKCILLHLPTPSAMITFRASEDILRLYYEKKTQNSSAGKRWIDVINELLNIKGIKKPLVDYLNYIRDKRNEAEHPDKVFTQYECEQAFMQVINLITEISKEIT